MQQEFGRDDRRDTLLARAGESFFAMLSDLSEGAIAVDRAARVAWMSEKYRTLLGLSGDDPVEGRPVEEIIPESKMRDVVDSGEATLLDIMQFGQRWFVVTRVPVRDEAGSVIGGLGFVLYDRVDYLRPVTDKLAVLQSELESTRRQLDRQRQSKYTFSQFVGTSRAARSVKNEARRAARLDANVLLTGETGSGKELLAHAIHAASPRAQRPFVGVSVAAIPETLLEAEFFGVAPGAYTGADRSGRAGKFALADGGTLFLDEIGDMPLPLQSKLLRVLQEQDIEPLGSNRVRHVDVRVVAATSRDLTREVEAGRFRSDLYYRLHVLPIVVPPLRDRLVDLEALCQNLLERIADEGGLPQRELTADALRLLEHYHWPGNVRELRNVLQRACAGTDATVLTGDDLSGLVPVAGHAAADPELRPLAEVLGRAERNALEHALRVMGGNKVHAARALGISRSRLYERLNRHPDLSA
jgi:transcriptional regulator with PAS, ATPase and Fis domain